MTAPSGPYRSLVSGMSPAQAAAWFKANRCPDNRRTAESAYVNAGISHTHRARPGKHEGRAEEPEREYYHQGRDARTGGIG